MFSLTLEDNYKHNVYGQQSHMLIFVNIIVSSYKWNEIYKIYDIKSVNILFLILFANFLDIFFIIVYEILNGKSICFWELLLLLFVVIPVLTLIILAMKKLGYSR